MSITVENITAHLPHGSIAGYKGISAYTTISDVSVVSLRGMLILLLVIAVVECWLRYHDIVVINAVAAAASRVDAPNQQEVL